ncbi:Serine/threonine exchanger SteT [Phycisphaerales bacterium]|nr:Serine/threonine exchanger SteT [Phycisphaerales bacterium]
MPTELPRKIGVWGATAVMVGVIIGSGIFRTPPDIARSLGSPAVILVFWLVGGLLALCGAFTYAELACMYPQSGGVYVFIREGFGRMAAFVFGWSYVLIMKPLGAAGIAVVFGEHMRALLGRDWHDAANCYSPGLGERLTGVLGDAWSQQLTTCLMLIVLTLINVRGVRLGTGVATVLTTAKFLAVAAIMLLPLLLGQGSLENLKAGPAPTSFFKALVPVMAGVMWTYDGWSDVGAIAGEVKDPSRNLPRIYLLGTFAVIGLYVLVNLSYMAVIPLTEMREMTTIAPAMLSRLMGGVAGAAAAGIIVVSTFGSTHGSIMTGARVTYQQSKDGLLFKFLSRVHPRYETPHVALWVQLGLSCTAVAFVKTFDKLAGGYVFLMWMFFGLAAVSVFVLRARRPDAPRPYRCWGYPIVPAIFILAAAGMTVLAVMENPATSAVWLGIIALGVPAYFIWRSAVERATPRRDPP